MNLGVGNLEKSQSKVLRVFDSGQAMTIKQTKQYFLSLPMKEVPNAIEKYKSDSRTGIKKICSQYEKEHKRYLKEYARRERLEEFDQVFTNNGQYLLAGVDEAGRGPLAGPVVAAAVILPEDVAILGIDDSKKLSEEKREQLYDEIMKNAISVGVGVVGAQEIDKINILQATFKAMRMAIADMVPLPEILLVDGNQVIPQLTSDIKQHEVVKGDAKSLNVAAASIIAKVTRDRMMQDYHKQYPEYAFLSNKGYGSIVHQKAIQEFGPSPIHRMTFLKNILKY